MDGRGGGGDGEAGRRNLGREGVEGCCCCCCCWRVERKRGGWDWVIGCGVWKWGVGRGGVMMRVWGLGFVGTGGEDGGGGERLMVFVLGG